MALTGNLTGSLSASMSAEGGVNGEITFDGSGTDNYNELDNKPSINGVVLEGNKTSADLHIESGGTDNYNDLLNKPKINGTILTGDVSDTQLLIDYNHLINKPVIPDISEIETRLDTAETDIDNLQTNMVTAQDDIATIKATDLTQNADINSLKNRVTGTETNISNLTTRVSSAETSISNHTTEISSIKDDVTGLDTRVDTNETNITTLQGNMTQAQSDISELNSNLTQLNGLTVYRNLTPQTSYVSFNDGSNLPLISLTTNIVPVQAGSGDPSPSNIRPISGFTEANVSVSVSGVNIYDGQTYNIQFKDGDNPLTVYGGTLDVVSGVLTVDRVNVDLGTLSWRKDTTTRPVDSATIHAFYAPVNNPKTYGTTVLSNVICSHYKTDTTRNVDYGGYNQVKDAIIGGADVNSKLWVYDSRYNDYSTSDFKSAMSGVTAVYELATPQTIQLTPTQVNSLLGQNYIFSDTGNITNVKYIGVLNFS